MRKSVFTKCLFYMNLKTEKGQNRSLLLFLLGWIFFLESLYLGMEYVLWVVQNPKKIHVCCTRICPPHSYIPSTFFSHTTIFYKKKAASMAFSKASLDYTYILFLIHYIFYELWEDDLTEISYYLFFFFFGNSTPTFMM